ncbi:MAG TPA: outer membrane protein assembly factor BamA [Candidatus Acidoferrales bacterium]|nr:outer membrane protein assembly factor BamA [Candidatus Acidoferrales bacterium]
MTRALAASRDTFLRAVEILVVVCLLPLAGGQSLWARQAQEPAGPQYVITRIEFPGTRRIARDTLTARIFSRVGDPYSVAAVRRDFQALWNTQFFEDIRLEVEDDPTQPNGKIILFHVTERPIIRRIEYKGNKSITESDILDAFKQKKVGLSVESQFDPTKIKRAEVVLKDLLAEHGRQFATVKPTYERIAASNAVKLVFNIDEGPKVKVGVISFVGNKAFSSRKIIRTMRHDRPYGIPLGFTYIPVMSKTFDRPKLDEDLEVGVRGLYQDHGYFKVVVDAKELKTVDLNRPGIPLPIPGIGSRHGKETNIVVSISEGAQYRMGKLTFRSSDPDQGLIFKPDALQRAFPLKEGDIFDADKIRKSLDNYRKLYGELGYIDFTAEPGFDVNDTKKVVDLTLTFDQQKEYFVRRIEFSGNTTTRDKVIRRELLLDEGQVFNNRLWELSILRLNQLGYFDTIKPDNAELKRNVKAGTVDIKLKVKEKGKQTIAFSGGVSGLSGSFVGFSYQTNNFLGLGETLTLSAQIGDIQRSINFGFTEPYLFDRPISTGFTVFSSKFDYNTARQEGILLGQQVAINPALQENYNTDSKGFTVFASYPLRKLSFTRLGLSYGWSTTNITPFSQSATLLFEFTKFTSLAGPSALNGIRQSAITPTISYDTRDSPIYPTHGKSFSYGASIVGGPLQGNVNTIGNSFEMTYFHPMYHRRNTLAFHLTGNMVTGFGGKEVPPNSRFYSGGEQDIRGFDVYTISPFVFIPFSTTTNITYLDPTVLNTQGQPTPVTKAFNVLEFVPTRPGGDLRAVSNVEYRIPLVSSYVTMSLFHDFGVNGILRRSQLQLDPSAIASIREQYPNPDFPCQPVGKPCVNIPNNLPVAGGTNFRPHTSAGIEIGIQIPIIQAPFRIYYAYNYLRLRQTITPPAGAFFVPPAERDALKQLGVFDTQIVPDLQNFLALTRSSQTIPPGLLEPKTTLRFAVSRTF